MQPRVKCATKLHYTWSRTNNSIGSVQESGAERDKATRKALKLITDAPAEEARRMARMVLASMDVADQERHAEQLIDLNLALGNHGEAAVAAVESALADQRAGDYKVCCFLLFAVARCCGQRPGRWCLAEVPFCCPRRPSSRRLLAHAPVTTRGAPLSSGFCDL